MTLKPKLKAAPRSTAEAEGERFQRACQGCSERSFSDTEASLVSGSSLFTELQESPLQLLLPL